MAARFDGSASPPPGYDEIVQFGSPRRGTRGWRGPLLLACVVIAAVLIAGTHHDRPRRPSGPSAVTTVSVGRGLLGVTAGWELFGFDGASMVAVQFARGLVIHTTLPTLQSTGPVSFVVGPDDAIVRPLDNVPGYLIPDRKPPRQLTGVLANGGVLLPGPAPGDDWFVRNTESIVLVGPDGRPTGVQVTGIPRTWPALSATADGRGELLIASETGALYDVAPGLLRPPGMVLLAAGPTTWFGLSCPRGRCHNVVVSIATGARRTLPGPATLIPNVAPAEMYGAVAPDGSAAAVFLASSNAGGPTKLLLINLRSGAESQIAVPVAPDSSAQQLAWSPDSRWLFVVTATGKLAVVNPRTMLAEGLDLGLSALSQIVIRPAGQ